MRKKIIIILFLIICAGSGYFIVSKKNKPDMATLPSQADDQVQQNLQSQVSSDLNSNETEQKTQPLDVKIPQKIEQKVPFVVQAPFANWKDPVFQNACEEAAIVMAMGWVNEDKIISAQDTQKRIKSIVDFENKKFGYNTDTDINDMQIIFRDFFYYSNINIQEKITLTDIKNEIQKENIVLVPAFGQALKNPNYTAPGPVTHMLVIIGYNPTAKKFITNDSGTKHGKNYLYPEDILFNAIWEYPSGSEVPNFPKKTRKKGMLVITKH